MKDKNTSKTSKICCPIKIHLLISGGALQAVAVAPEYVEKVEVCLYDADNNPEIEEDFEEITKNHTEISF